MLIDFVTREPKDPFLVWKEPSQIPLFIYSSLFGGPICLLKAGGIPYLSKHKENYVEGPTLHELLIEGSGFDFDIMSFFLRVGSRERQQRNSQ